jgi:hypothetical protein
LESDRDEFLNNPLHTILDVNKATTKDFNVENYIQKLLKEEAIPFEVIDLKNNDVLPKITDLALDKKPPFEGNGGDKGFKDALIYFSVLEYLQKTPNKKVFVCVKDKRLKKAFNKHHNIIVVEGYEEFKEQSISQFFDDYFIEKVNEEIIEVDITKEHIVEFWNNINEKKIVLIKIEDTEYVIEVESFTSSSLIIHLICSFENEAFKIFNISSSEKYFIKGVNSLIALCVVAKLLALIRYSIFVLYNSGLEVLIISLDSTSITYSVSSIFIRTIFFSFITRLKVNL